MKPWIVPLLLLLAACERTPEEARKKLESHQVPVTEEALIAKTKNAKTEDVAKLLVEAGVDPNARQANGMTALMSAAFNGQHDVAKALLTKGANANAQAKGFNALSMAVERDDKAMVELLLAHGADPSVRPTGGISALEKAKQLQKSALVTLLEKSAK